MMIKGLQRLTLIDYPGKVACTVFVFGCNFRCSYCHNPELVIDDGRKIITEEEIFRFFEDRKNFLEGVCVTGGEPTLQEDLPEFLSKIKQIGYLVKLDTNGTNPEMLERMMKEKLLDFIAMDIKYPLEKYEEIVGVPTKKEDIQKSIDLIRRSGIEYEFRTTILPKFFTERELLQIGEWLNGSKKYFLQQFQPTKTLDENLKNERTFTKEEMEKFTRLLKPFFEEVGSRGMF